MLTNISKFECQIRFITGSLIWVFYLTGSMTGNVFHFLAVIGVILVSTSIMRFCAYYLVFELQLFDGQK